MTHESSASGAVEDLPEFRLRLLTDGPDARGRLLAEMGTNGSPKFLVLAGSPVRAEVVPSFAEHVASAYRLRAARIADGTLVPSERWPSYLEAVRDIECNSPSGAAAVCLGLSANGRTDWKTAEGRPVGDFIAQTGSDANSSTLRRTSQLVLGLFELLAEHPEGLHYKEAVDALQERLPPTAYERTSGTADGRSRYQVSLGFHTSGPVKYGWLNKNSGVWSLTLAGREALERFRGVPDAYGAEAARLWKEWQAGSDSAERRAWLVRGANVDGGDLIHSLWMPDGLVSVPAVRLRRDGVAAGTTREALQHIVAVDFEAIAAYSEQDKLVDQFHAFLTRMRPGDAICTASAGKLFVGEITGPPTRLPATADQTSGLRRQVSWEPTGHDADQLPEALRQLLSTQDDVVELTVVLDDLTALRGDLGREGLIESMIEELEQDPLVELPTTTIRRELRLPDADEALRDRLMVHDVVWLQKRRTTAPRQPVACRTGSHRAIRNQRARPAHGRGTTPHQSPRHHP
jgi:hypothetical protein